MTPSEGNGDSRNRLEASDFKAAMEMILGEDGKNSCGRCFADLGSPASGTAIICPNCGTINTID